MITLYRANRAPRPAHAAPFYRSQPGRGLLLSSLAIGAITLWLPYSSLAELLGFTSLSPALLLTLAAITTLYVLAAELAKRVFYPRKARPLARAAVGEARRGQPDSVSPELIAASGAGLQRPPWKLPSCRLPHEPEHFVSSQQNLPGELIAQ